MNAWPRLDYAADKGTIETLHLLLQLIGKLPLRLHPWINHGWHVALRMTPSGAITRPLPAGERHFTVELDFLDGSIRVEATETLGQYADWLQIPTQKLRNVNKLKPKQPVLLGQKLNLDYSRVSREAFEQVRRDYHAKLQAEFFVQHRISGTEVYVVRRGDSLWTMTQKFSNLPIWLLRQYNPDTDLSDLRAGTQVVMPRVEVLAGS